MPEKISKSFAKSFFAGRIAEDLVFPYPLISQDESETLNLVLESLKRFAQDHIDPVKIEEQKNLSPELLKQLGELGIFGLMIPQEYGGLGLSQQAYGRVFEEIAAIDASIAVTLGAHSSIGMKGLLLHGSEEQKKQYLPKLATGEMFAAFALTEPGSGSDAYSIRTRAEEQGDGSYIINGNKIWITNGGFADFFTVFAKTTNEKGEDKITAFIVTRDMEGFSNGPEEKKLGIRASSTVELSFNNVRVPAENILGVKGKGFKQAMEILNSGRLGLATGCVGGAKVLLKLAAEHATQRKQFDRPIAEFGIIKEKLGLMATEIYAVESASYLTCGMVDAEIEDYSMESAICKIAGSEMLWRVANEAMQIAGGTSYMQEYPYERMLRDARIHMIFEGTNEILRVFIALSGIKEPGERLKLLSQASLNDPIKSVGLLYDFVMQKISRSIYGDEIKKAHPELKRETAWVEEYVVAIANTSEKILQKYRNKVLDMQLVQKRLAEIAIDLFMMVASISRTTRLIEDGKPNNEALTMTRSFCAMAAGRIRHRLKEMDRNQDELLKETASQVSEKKAYPIEGNAC